MSDLRALRVLRGEFFFHIENGWLKVRIAPYVAGDYGLPRGKARDI